MARNTLSPSIDEKATVQTFFIPDNDTPFTHYIDACRALVMARRQDLSGTPEMIQRIIDVNTPFELRPADAHHCRYGALLIHGLFDSPFSNRDLGEQLQAQGIFCRSILLPGHGTRPSDLLHVTYHDWLQTVRYGIAKLREEVDQVILVGFSTGAALSIYHALQDSQIAAIILLAPAIRIKAPIDALIHWQYLTRWLHTRKKWIIRDKETDYAKYHSLPFNPVFQLSNLIDAFVALHERHPLNCPVFMSVSEDDETISSRAAINFFNQLANHKNRLLQYTTDLDEQTNDGRVMLRNGIYPALHIDNISHMALPFKPSNFHYGQHGDYPLAAHLAAHSCVYGAYNRIEVMISSKLYKLGLQKKKRRELTYNPDFDFLSHQIMQFIRSIT